MDDHQIISLFFQRDQGAISAVETQYGGLVRRIGRNILQQEEDVAECESDTYLGLWNAIPPEKPNPLAAFIAKIARNIALNCRRRRLAEKRRSDSFGVSMEELEDILAAPSVEEQFSAAELGRSIDRFLQNEDIENRKLFLRRYWFGESVGTLAEELNIGENAVSARLSRIRKRLKKHLIKEGFTA